eukprot:11175346-Lingulodinium_polyedra.AAC.1
MGGLGRRGCCSGGSSPSGRPQLMGLRLIRQAASLWACWHAAARRHGAARPGARGPAAGWERESAASGGISLGAA